MSALLGLRWVRAIWFDEGVRDDWVNFLEQRKASLSKKLVKAHDEIDVRWTQGRLLELEDLTIFIDSALTVLKNPENSPENR